MGSVQPLTRPSLPESHSGLRKPTIRSDNAAYVQPSLMLKVHPEGRDKLN
jgi:hypothetical protein